MPADPFHPAEPASLHTRHLGYLLLRYQQFCTIILLERGNRIPSDTVNVLCISHAEMVVQVQISIEYVAFDERPLI